MVGFPFLGFPSLTGVPFPDGETIYTLFLPEGIREHTVTHDYPGLDCNPVIGYHNFGMIPVVEIKFYVIPVLSLRTFPYAVHALDCAMSTPVPNQSCTTDSDCAHWDDEQDVPAPGYCGNQGYCVSGPEPGALHTTITHEMIEASVNPLIGFNDCWIDTTQSHPKSEGETADLCESQHGRVGGGSAYFNGRWVATYWSNQDDRCIPSSSPVDYTFIANGLPNPASISDDYYSMRIDGVDTRLHRKGAPGESDAVFQTSVYWEPGSSHSYEFVSPISDPSNRAVNYFTPIAGRQFKVPAGPAQEVVATYAPSVDVSFHIMTCSAVGPAASRCPIPPVDDPALLPRPVGFPRDGWYAPGTRLHFATPSFLPSETDPDRWRFDQWLAGEGHVGSGYASDGTWPVFDYTVSTVGGVHTASYVRQHAYHFASEVDGVPNVSLPYHLKVWTAEDGMLLDAVGVNFDVYVDEEVRLCASSSMILPWQEEPSINS